MSEQLTMMPRISLNVEVPEELHAALQSYVETHPAWSQHRVFCAALSLFLMQNGVTDRQINRLYLDTVFDYAA
jgi:predicted TPR repeat methyltransferase